MAPSHISGVSKTNVRLMRDRIPESDGLCSFASGEMESVTHQISPNEHISTCGYQMKGLSNGPERYYELNMKTGVAGGHATKRELSTLCLISI